VLEKGMKAPSKTLLGLAAATVLFLASPSYANLITNGGFETGDLTSWAQFGNTAFSGVTIAPHSGRYAAFFGPAGSTGGIYQDLGTTPGGLYDLSFWLRNDGSGPNSFSVSWNGVTIPGSVLVNSAPFGYTQFSFTGLLATTGFTEVRFAFRHDPSFWYLDDVSVGTAVSSVPEVFSTLWLALPFCGIIGFRLFREKQRS
jgi:flagellin